MLREATETTALNQTGDTDGGAAATLNVRASLGCDGVIGLQPDCSGANGDRPLRSVSGLATLRNKTRVDCDVMHVARPDQERIGPVRRALIAVAATFDDEAQPVFAGEVHSGSDVVSISCGDCINTGFRGPSINPAQGLGNAGVITDVVGIFQACEESLAASTL